MANATPAVVYVVSDAAGETGELVVRAAAIQFMPDKPEIRRVPFVAEPEDIDRVIESARRENAMIVFTLVIPTLRDHLVRQASIAGVASVDLLSPVISGLESLMRREALHRPGISHPLDDDYFKKVEAVEFAVKYDDGRDPAGIVKADVVLIGVSRTSKTPLSMYLAHKKYKVANVPLVPELKPPDELFKVPRNKVFGLLINPEKLNAIRRERLRALGLGPDAMYANALRIEQELAYATDIMRRIGCMVIDVSDKAVEETAWLILDRLSGR
ncbi:pyruvate, water dikinase regulatory protein [Paenibacillus thermoaerophilus]|uniref:Putative pyruvate, phosphate dikinase regulatory protein n=1 Tax=Paenibacillus thermoaerophilus TaxID=1215385 RepID=A0ABW2V1W4_9BACL|nr:pyruvate, water dikinase regulatory protein [Paenibacillus thermoaerophilus]TMV19035.1 kinase/pyrophosphorylase [Paenibacillus thermoaerophilus]